MSDLFCNRFNAIKKSVTIEDLRRCRQERKTKLILFRGLGSSLLLIEESIVEDKRSCQSVFRFRGLNIELRYAANYALLGWETFTQQLERASELEEIVREKVLPVASKRTSGQVAEASVAKAEESIEEFRTNTETRTNELAHFMYPRPRYSF